MPTTRTVDNQNVERRKHHENWTVDRQRLLRRCQLGSMVELVRAADRFGVDFAWTAEAWGMETIAPLAYLAPLTERIRLGTGSCGSNARTPATTAMTALTMARRRGR